MPELHCENITYPSADGAHTIAAYLYTVPGVKVRAVIQLCHGMTEYIGRYRHMAQFYAEHGIALAGNDHLGHGNSAAPQERGHYGEKNGRFHLLKDLHTMNGILHERFPGLPLIFYGHSMGSFYARWYAEVWPDTISMLVISGTAGPGLKNPFGRLLAGAVAGVRGDRYVSRVIPALAHGSYNARIPDAADHDAWLTRDTGWSKRQLSDGMGGFTFTAGTYREMLATLCHVSSKRWARHIRKDLPVLLIAGAEDPVGDYGKGPRAVWAMLGDAGVRDLTCQIWEGGRHEMHNELNRDEVFDYCLTWMEDRIGKETE